MALFHRHVLAVALTGLAVITLYKLAFTGFKAAPGIAGLGAHGRTSADALKGSIFLRALVTCVSMMPVEKLPAAWWQTAFGLGFVSAVFDNIPSKGGTTGACSRAPWGSAAR